MIDLSPLVDDQLLKALIRRCEITDVLLRRREEELITKLVPLEPQALEDAISNLIGNHERESWLLQRGWTEDDLRLCAARPLALDLFAQQRFGPGLEEAFLSSRGAHDEIVYSLLRVRDAGLSRELYLRLAEGEIAFPEAARQFSEGPEACHQGLIGPIRLEQLQPQELVDALRGLQPGELAKPLSLGGWHVILRLEHFSSARLDDSTRQTLLHEQLDAFLVERVKSLKAGNVVEALCYETDADSAKVNNSSGSSDLI